jgi:hypothetical protein
MTNPTSLGLDELMIVNPGKAGATGTDEIIFFGEDGRLYQVVGLDSGESMPESTEFFLGDDGKLYQIFGLNSLVEAEGNPNELAGTRRLPRFFIGDDGTIYEVRNRKASG